MHTPDDKLSIRRAEAADLDRIQTVYAGARVFMREHGNPTQWGDSYPEEDMLRRDLAEEQLYVLESGDGQLRGVFALIAGEDPTYGEIDGAWLNDLPYLSIHRVASSGVTPGITRRIVDWSFGRCRNLRIDTHPDNRPMRRAIERCGFTRCGIIRYFDGSPRIAYQRILPEEGKA